MDSNFKDRLVQQLVGKIGNKDQEQEKTRNQGGPYSHSKQSTSPVPVLNLSNLKHVKEYTSQKTIFLENNQQTNNEQAPKRPKSPITDNQWYHYATQLEMNVKHLRKQIDNYENQLVSFQSQLEAEKQQKEKLLKLNYKLTCILKQNSSKSIIDNNKSIYNSISIPNKYSYVQPQQQFSSYDSQQQQFAIPPTHIQINNLQHLYHSNQFYQVQKEDPNLAYGDGAQIPTRKQMVQSRSNHHVKQQFSKLDNFEQVHDNRQNQRVLQTDVSPIKKGNNNSLDIGKERQSIIKTETQEDNVKQILKKLVL